MKLGSIRSRRSAARRILFAALTFLTCVSFVAAGRIFPALGGFFTSVSAQSREFSKDPEPAAQTVVSTSEKQVSDSALRQIESLLREKESRTPAQKKVDSRLLYKIKMERKQAIAEGVEKLESDLVVDEKGFIDVDISALVSDALLQRLKEIGADVKAAFPQYRSITARVPITEIEALAGRDDVLFVQPHADGTTNRTEPPRPMDLSSRLFFSTVAQTASVAPLTFNQRADRVRNFLRQLLAALSSVR
jgi:hypothetical protein